MNDFLDNLVVRTLQLSPVVRPRLPSLFEPLSAPGHASASHQDETSTFSASDIPGPRPLARPGAQEPATFELGSRTITSDTIETGNSNNPGPSGTGILQANEVSQSAPQIMTKLAAQRITPEASSMRSLTANAAQTPDSKSESEPQDVIETTARRVMASRGAGSAMSRDHAKLLASNEASPFSGTEAAPTISVTIGRVDVRAVYPQPQAQPARRTRPAPMSLDEYFKRRSEGRK